MRTRLLRRALTPLLAACAVTCLVPAATASATDPGQCMTSGGGRTSDLRPGQRLDSGASLVPTPGKPELAMQDDGNLVIYAVGNPGGPRLPLWSSGTYGNPGAYALMQDDGNFVVYKRDGGPDKGGALWATGTYGNRNTTYVSASFRDDGQLNVTGRREDWYWSTETSERHVRVCSTDMSWTPGFWARSATAWLVLQKDNNLVMYRKRDGKAIWSSGTYGNRNALNLQMKDNGDLVLREDGRNQTVRWHSGSAGNNGAYALLQDDGNFVVYKADGGPGKGGALWASGTYNKV
ncbi:Curculin domain protein (mannose-binding) lectin [Actinobacteria bacterium OV450]|nr:Curculin domain protein (mannose-binding) lectin [Actinobacteria bacterium OV450]